jgi:hypothetical protein
MCRFPSRAGAFMLLCATTSSALSTMPDQHQSSSSRRAFLGRVVPVGVVFLQPGLIVAPAHAYDRRDVGGEDASPVTKAMNLQAYETNNRLERAGLKLEVRPV